MAKLTKNALTDDMSIPKQKYSIKLFLKISDGLFSDAKCQSRPSNFLSETE